MQKKTSVGELELLAVVWGLERFRFYLYGKQVQLFSDHQTLEPLLKKKQKKNKQYSARLTRWLDRIKNCDITIKYTAGEEINFISKNPRETLSRMTITKKNSSSTPSRRLKRFSTNQKAEIRTRRQACMIRARGRLHGTAKQTIAIPI